MNFSEKRFALDIKLKLTLNKNSSTQNHWYIILLLEIFSNTSFIIIEYKFYPNTPNATTQNSIFPNESQPLLLRTKISWDNAIQGDWTFDETALGVMEHSGNVMRGNGLDSTVILPHYPECHYPNVIRPNAVTPNAVTLNSISSNDPQHLLPLTRIPISRANVIQGDLRVRVITFEIFTFRVVEM